MAGLDPAIHVFLVAAPKTWMPGTSPGMTERYGYRPLSPFRRILATLVLPSRLLDFARKAQARWHKS